jgi:hydrogenase expression/formation protein HypC
MCIAYPGRVIELDETGVVVETEGRRRRASVLLVPETKVGDWVVVSTGAVIRVLDPDDAAEITQLLDEATGRSEEC